MVPKLFDLTGKVALVSGAASGMGRASAQALASHGAGLFLVDRDDKGLENTAHNLRFAGARVETEVADVSREETAFHLGKRLDEAFGRIDFLANIAGDGLLCKPEDLHRNQLEQVFANLVFGRFALCRELGKRMLTQGGGSIVNIGSLASITALGRGHIAYSMAMGAVAQMTRELSTEWSGRGVRVNAILPAQVKNPSLEQRMASDPAILAKWLSGIPRGRLGQPEDIQGLVVLLASDASSWITGTLIPMDGGNLAMNAGGTIGS